MPRAIKDTPTSANDDAHDLIDLIISILSPLWLTSSQLVYLLSKDDENKLPHLVVGVYRAVEKFYLVIKKGGRNPLFVKV
tara:strand:+ start:31 stop:270 length:240 start_codon:yes stop_codon:yes gene_type:complete